VATSFKLDLLFNYASLAILATSGLVANLVVARLMGEAALGVFNQSFAIYIACSQLAVGGVHISVLRSVAQAESDSESRAPIVASGLLLAFGLGAVLCTFVLLSRNAWGLLLGSPEVIDSLSWVGPALLLFSLNKTLLAALNGQGRMRAFAVLQASRYIVLVAALTLLAWYRRPAAELSSALLYAEIAVLLGATPCLLGGLALRRRHIRASWLKHHLMFGAKGVLSGVFVELNTRVDVLAIGWFSSDADVGRYSLAAVFAEGLYQCLIVVRNQMSPVLAKLLADHDRDKIVDLVRRSWKYLYPGMICTYLAGLGVFHVVLTHLQTAEPSDALYCYAILGAGVLAVSGFVPFDSVLLHSGRPGYHTLFTFLVTGTNLILNLLLIPVWGIIGAALATALALGLSVVYLSVVMRWQLGFSYLNRKPA
jgi:O-antigen/teichoic acid export membrane protein